MARFKLTATTMRLFGRPRLLIVEVDYLPLVSETAAAPVAFLVVLLLRAHAHSDSRASVRNY